MVMPYTVIARQGAGVSLAHCQGHSYVIHSSSCHDDHQQHQHCQDYPLHGGERQILETANSFIANINTLQPVCQLGSNNICHNLMYQLNVREKHQGVSERRAAGQLYKCDKI